MTLMTAPKIRSSFSRKTSLALIYLAEALRLKRCSAIKVRDLERYLGLEDHGLKTILGKVLNSFVRAGLAVRYNNARPRRYMIKPWVADLITEYGFTCFFGGECPYLGSCPIREAVREVVKQ